MSFQPIANYGVIGKIKSIALIRTNGSIDLQQVSQAVRHDARQTRRGDMVRQLLRAIFLRQVSWHAICADLPAAGHNVVLNWSDERLAVVASAAGVAS